MGSKNTKTKESDNLPKGFKKPPTALEIKTLLMVAQSKIGIYRQRKAKGIKLKTKEIVTLLSKGNIEIAKAKMESIMREEDIISAYDILTPICEILKEKVTYIMTSTVCPPDLHPTLDTLVYGGARVDVDELHNISELLGYRYGPGYIAEAQSNSFNSVNPKLISKLSMNQYPPSLVIVRLRQTAKMNNIIIELPDPELDESLNVSYNTKEINNNFGGQNGYNQQANPYNQYGGNDSQYSSNPYNQMGGGFDDYKKTMMSNEQPYANDVSVFNPPSAQMSQYDNINLSEIQKPGVNNSDNPFGNANQFDNNSVQNPFSYQNEVNYQNPFSNQNEANVHNPFEQNTNSNCAEPFNPDVNNQFGGSEPSNNFAPNDNPFQPPSNNDNKDFSNMQFDPYKSNFMEQSPSDQKNDMNVNSDFPKSDGNSHSINDNNDNKFGFP